MLRGLIPPTGIPLPFISAGGSSLVVFLTAIGVLLNISKNSQNYKSFETGRLGFSIFKSKRTKQKV